MSGWETLLLACALAMDATAVSLAARATGASRGKRAGWRLGWHFGLFQGFMPLAGAGYWMGARAGDKLGPRMNVAGGLILLGIGLKILLTHIYGA